MPSGKLLGFCGIGFGGTDTIESEISESNFTLVT